MNLKPTNISDEEKTRIFEESLKNQTPYVEKEPVKIRSVKCCRMIPLEPDCRGYTDVFICTNCHQHIHLGFIRKEYSGSFCLECGAEVKDGERIENNKTG